LSGNGHLNVPWSTNLKGEGSETVAQVDNTAGATETADALHRAEAAAVEQPALSEASPALEVSSEPAPAPAMAVDEEGQAATEHGGAPLLEKELTPRSPVGSNKPNSFGSS
jgi:hypothetical protein